MAKKPPSPYIGQTQSLGEQQQTQGQSNINQGVGQINQAVNNPTSSPLYKALYSTEAGQMSKAYDTAASNTAAKARQAGFGYQQPVAQGAQDELRSKEASAIGQLPGQVEQQVVPEELQAGQAITSAGTSELGAGNQLYGQATPLEQQYAGYSYGYSPLNGVLGSGLGNVLKNIGGLTGSLALGA